MRGRLDETRQRVDKMQCRLQLRIGQDPEQIVEYENKSRGQQSAIGQTFADGNATTCMIRKQTQWCKGFILSRTSFDAYCLPGELFEYQDDTLLGILEPCRT